MKCECPIAGACARRGGAIMPPVHHARCQAGQGEAIDRFYAGTPNDAVGPQTQTQVARKKARRVLSREAVGAALKKRIEGLLSIKARSACNCTALAAQMDMWGIAGCERRRDQIIGQLCEHRDMVVDALKQAKWVGWLAGAIAEHAPEAMVRAGATWLFEQAIEDVRKSLPKQIGNGRHPFEMGKSAPRFITLEQYAEDVRKLLDIIPHDVDAVAGVARSGLYPASMVAMWLHKPMFVVSQAAGNITEAGNGWRLGNGHHHIPPGTGKVLVVDDTVMTGGSQEILRRVIGDKFKEVLYATVYCNPAANLAQPDMHAVDLEWPHLLEWNLFNSVISNSAAVDFDGVLCHDCPIEDDDDGPRYLDFIQNARPLYLPRKEPIPLIVTARVEKYRKPTEEWLRRHGVRWKKLIMHPAKSTKERMKDDVPAYKAKHFEAWAKTHKPAPGPIMFVESEDWQARRIAEITGRMTICPSTAGVY